MTELRVVKEWFQADFRFARWDRDVEVVCDTADCFSFRVYTELHNYRISAHTCPDREYHYLGCITKCRKPRAGEDWTRGSDLVEGDLTPATWHRILADIVSYELVRVHRKEDALKAADEIHSGEPSTQPTDFVRP